MRICKINQIKENKPKRTKTIQQTIEDQLPEEQTLKTTNAESGTIIPGEGVINSHSS